LTNDGKNLIMSNGTNELIWLDPENFSEIKKILIVSEDSDFYEYYGLKKG